MRIAMIPLLLVLAACASPSPEFLAAPRHDLQIDGIDFAVFQKANRAEVIRLGYLSRRDRERVPGLMMQAAEQASGCRAIPFSLKTRVPGDTAEARINLKC
ncbi:hypothetical protein [Paracoccus sp. KR1-242]|uniref:hypothetical protein n=1 Tax=Paracoccus sp. KR1-242 TaxID=3410028 RepID=UPI003C0866B6